jgi:hypothetical protein
MGNQLFQWAFGLSASRRLGTRFAMPTKGIASLFELDADREHWSRLHGHAWLALNRVRRRPVVEVGGDDEPKSVLAALRDGLRYGGFFQSADYFSGSEDAVRRALAVRRKHRRRFERSYPGLAEQGYVCVHVRRGDYLEWGVDLPWSYHRRCLDLVRTDLPIVFISDDIAAVEAEFGSLAGARFESNDPIIDFQLMTHASLCVVSNSSFAWWGAWLNRTPGKRVLAPRHWVGFKKGRESPRHVIPADWDQIEVESPG